MSQVQAGAISSGPIALPALLDAGLSYVDLNSVALPRAAAPLGIDLGGPTLPLRSALQLRFEVYCNECKFLPKEDYPDGLESDEYDASAAHFYAYDSDGELVGYVRLIVADVDRQLPLQRHCSIFEGTSAPLPRQAAEISRLMVRKDYRRRRDDGLAGATTTGQGMSFAGDRRHEAPKILMDLYKQMYAYSRRTGIRYWYAAMERTLRRSLSRSGYTFECIGPETDYYGDVTPYRADLRKLEVEVGSQHPVYTVDNVAGSTSGVGHLA